MVGCVYSLKSEPTHCWSSWHVMRRVHRSTKGRRGLASDRPPKPICMLKVAIKGPEGNDDNF